VRGTRRTRLTGDRLALPSGFMGRTQSLQSFGSYDLHVDHVGRLWIATSAGLVVYEGGHFRQWRTPEGLRTANVRTLEEGKDGSMFVGTRQGLWQIAGGQASELAVPGASWPDSACAIVCEPGGVAWIAHGNRLFLLRDGQLQIQGSSADVINALEVSRDGALWCGWQDRLVRWPLGQTPEEVTIVLALRSQFPGARSWWALWEWTGRRRRTLARPMYSICLEARTLTSGVRVRGATNPRGVGANAQAVRHAGNSAFPDRFPTADPNERS